MAGSAETESRGTDHSGVGRQARGAMWGHMRRTGDRHPNIYMAHSRRASSSVNHLVLLEPEFRALVHNHIDNWTCRVQWLVIA